MDVIHDVDELCETLFSVVIPGTVLYCGPKVMVLGVYDYF